MTQTISRKLQILCLHGFKQHGQNFKHRCNSLQKVLRNYADLHFIDAPHKLPTLTEKDTTGNESEVKNDNYLTWWNTVEEKNATDKIHKIRYDGLSESIRLIAEVNEKNGPFDGILGFSQGGVLLAILCALREREKFVQTKSDVVKTPLNTNWNESVLKDVDTLKFKFAWIVGSFKPRDSSVVDIFNICSQNTQESIKLEIPTMIVVGKGDDITPLDTVVDLSRCFKNPYLVIHDRGHYIPVYEEVNNKYIVFLKQFL
ncbi:hypothetical protein RFI_03736 [Reticulomyxa filosa]|uniref:Serine hydrolase domain-containing protein n=1 Tax=Reticulomyxa filosa TaxID=46433 RepID=X6P6Y4_RETFI|nr:hypothetical protein RFI_03736 [Reticulomyxa filosa]|eukprot:ETO33372.1 hypothetical protein RFI_03736 [Reticulomyxa filosa]